MDSTEVFHAGEQAVQARVGVRERMAARGWQFIRNAMPEQHRTFFPLLPYLPVALRDSDGWPVGTMLTAEPGFVSSLDPKRLRVAALPGAGDPAATGLSPGAPVGVLGIDLTTRRRNRVNGRVTEVDAAGFTVAVEQSFGNCAQYIHLREPEANSASRGPTEALGGLDAAARGLIAASDTFFVASGTGEAGLDMSHRAGGTGFVQVEGDVLTIPDFAGNRYFNTLGNFLLDPRAGVLFVDFATGTLLQLNGRAGIEWDGPDVAAYPGAQRLWRLQVTRGWRTPFALPLRWAPA